MSPEHCKTAKAAALLDSDEETLRHWRRKGAGPPYRRFGRLIRYHVPTLLAWAEQQTQNPL